MMRDALRLPRARMASWSSFFNPQG